VRLLQDLQVSTHPVWPPDFMVGS